MRFLHTSDWHVGKPLRNHKRDDEYAAALAEVLDIAKREAIDCVLVAGDVFDTSVPPHEAERIVFDFFSELAGAEIPAVVIAGNHDHPRRWEAYASVFRHLGVHVRGEPVSAGEGGCIEIPSRDGSESAVIAALPWVSERKVRDFDSLMQEGDHAIQYADGVSQMIGHLCRGFRADAARLLVAHVFLSGAAVGPESGERQLHVGDLYAITPQAIPSEVQYAALGHVHNPDQPNLKLANGFYSGSLLRCDFGEANHRKGVRIIDVTATTRAKDNFIKLSSPKRLRNVGSHKEGATLDELKTIAGGISEDYVKVFIKVDRPLPGLAEEVREIVPNAVDIVVQRTDIDAQDEGPQIQRMSAQELFAAYHEGTYGSAPAAPLLALFSQLYEEASVAAN
ncbi:MAG TPA: exonuclease SbcCD subunit D [Dehalococcoidia bacterium]|nr:exonuclease SbcCD subunit D [Dehalococcoidia bacterium]